MKDISIGLVLSMYAAYLMLAFIGVSTDADALACIDQRALDGVISLEGNAISSSAGCSVSGVSQEINNIKTALTEEQNIIFRVTGVASGLVGTLAQLLLLVLKLITLLFIGWFQIFDVIFSSINELKFVSFFIGGIISIIQIWGTLEIVLDIGRSLPR